MSAEKLVIKYEEDKRGTYSGSILVDFNPSQLSFSSNATWTPVEPTSTGKKASPAKTVFRSVSPDTLSLTLFFDTYAPYASDIAGGELPSPRDDHAPKAGESVENRLNAVLALTRVRPKLNRPPACRLSWGRNTIFHGVLTSASRTYTLFLPDGTPVRATMECSFRQVVGDLAVGDSNIPVGKEVYIVKPGDTLMSIAASCYGNGGLWRKIAIPNGIEKPRDLVPGQTLTIPRDS